MAERTQGSIVYNTGARLVYSFSEHLCGLINELGLSDSVIPLPLLSANCEYSGRNYKLYLNSNLRMLANPMLTILDKIKLIFWGIELHWLRKKVSPNFMITGNQYDDQTLADYIERKLGPRFLKYVIEPIFRGTRSWNPEEITPAFFMTTTPHLASGSNLFVFKEGMGQLTRAIADKLNVRFNCPVSKLTRHEGGGVLCETGSGEVLRADVVISATPGACLDGLVENPTSMERSLIKAVRYNKLGVVHYALNSEVMQDIRFIPKSAGSRLSTYQQLPSSLEQKRPNAMLYCQLTPEASEEAERRGMTDRLDELIREDVRAFYPEIDKNIDAIANQWIPHKLPIPYPGYGKIVDRFLSAQASSKQDIYYCGDYLSQALVTGACESGINVADLVRKHWSDSD